MAKSHAFFWIEIMTAYSDKYDEMLVRHMEAGYSFESFSQVVRVGVPTLKRWVDDNPTFRVAKEIGEGCLMYKWEQIGIAGVMGKVKNFSAPTYKTVIQRFFGKLYEDRQKIEHSVNPETGPIVIYQLPSNGRDGENDTESGTGTDNI